MEDSSIWDLTTSGRLQSISDSVCPIHDFCLYYSVQNWVCNGGISSTCKEIKQLERPRLALFASSRRGESHSAETIIQLPSKSFPHAAFPFFFGCGGGGGGSCAASSSSSSSFSSRLKTLGSCSSLIRLHSAFNLLRSSEVIWRAFHKSPEKWTRLGYSGQARNGFTHFGSDLVGLRAECCLMPP